MRLRRRSNAAKMPEMLIFCFSDKRHIEWITYSKFRDFAFKVTYSILAHGDHASMPRLSSRRRVFVPHSEFRKRAVLEARYRDAALMRGIRTCFSFYSSYPPRQILRTAPEREDFSTWSSARFWRDARRDSWHARYAHARASFYYRPLITGEAREEMGRLLLKANLKRF